MSYIGILTSFDHTCQTWATYKSRINQWYIANDISPTSDAQGIKRRGILLSALSDRTYKLTANLALPAEIQEVPYEDIIKLMDEHFTPKRLGFTERYKFYTAFQNHDSNTEFVARLRGLSEFCEFKDVEEALRDRFVLGLRPGPARDKLFEQKLDELTLTQALEIAENFRCVQDANDPNYRYKNQYTGFIPPQNNPHLIGPFGKPHSQVPFGNSPGGTTFGCQNSTAFGSSQPSGGPLFGIKSGSQPSNAFGAPPSSNTLTFGAQPSSIQNAGNQNSGDKKETGFKL